ncbi:MAG: MATE family efflux transporter [Gammaproteobacteria bacterium]|nr:MATE family efflux transporter [Gammaproteobacteria bacterium]
MKLNLRIWKLAWPVILSNISIPAIGMVDIAVVGHDYPSDVLSAVAIGTMVFDVLFGLFMFLRMSTTGLVAQQPDKKVIVQRALLTSLIISILIISFRHYILLLITSVIPMSLSIQDLLQTYFELRVCATPAALANYVLMGYFFGKQNTRTALLMLLVINCSGIGLDFIFVKYLGMGIKGLAMANLISQIMGCVLGGYILHKRYAAFVRKNEPLLDFSALVAFFHINKDIFIRSVCLMLTIAAFTQFGAKLGPKVVAANAVLMSMHQFSAYFLDGLAISCETLVGEAVGQKNYSKLIQAIKACTLFSIGVGCGLSLILWISGRYIIDLMSSLPEVTLIAKANLVWVALLPALSVASFLLDGIFIGATWSKPMRNTMIISTFGVFFPMCLLLEKYDNKGLWIAFLSFIIARGIFLGNALSKELKHNQWR